MPMRNTLRHPGEARRAVPRTVELAPDDDSVTLARVLEALHRRGQRVPVHVAVYIAHELARGLRHIHDVEGRVHGAVAAGEVLLLRSGKVRLVDHRPAAAGATPHGDLRAIGRLAWEMLVGWPLESPARPAPLAPSLLRAGLPPAVDDLVLRALDLDPRRRYAGPGVLVAESERFLATRPDPRRSLRLLLDQLGEAEAPPAPDSTATRLTAVPWRDAALDLEPAPAARPTFWRRHPWLVRLAVRALETAIASVLALLALLALTGPR